MTDSRGGRDGATDSVVTVSDKPARAADDAERAAGTRIGRYVLQQRLGRGGMGEVFRARDTELARDVALKLLHVGTARRTERARRRLLREAQALAQLNHPNVVGIYDAGSDGGDVFLAEELVEGESLRDWLKAKPRSRKEILATFLAAGRGLEAIHAAGLVHRDFKPDNVHVGSDGRVRVLDLGLARIAGYEHWDEQETSDSGQVSEHSTDSAQHLRTPVTQFGAVVGTPAYMAPEQQLGAKTDARCDVFSFCVAVFEALCGTRPFEREELTARLAQIGAGKLSPESEKLPRWLLRVLRRGLASKQEDRYQSMAALLDALARDPATKWRRLAPILAAALACAAVGFGAWRMSEQRDEVCRGAERKLLGAWDATMRARVTSGLAVAGASRETINSVSSTLDQYAQSLVTMHTEACEATQVRGEQSADVMALRMACLDGRAKELGALTALLASADRDAAQKSLEAVGNLPGLAACADSAALSARVPPPKDMIARLEVDRLRGRLAQARALSGVARYASARSVLDEIVAADARLGYGPLHAELLTTRGDVLEADGHAKEAAAAFSEALRTAYASRDDALVARAASDLADTTGFWLAHHAEGHEWNKLAGAAIARLGGSDELEAERAQVEASLYTEEGKGDEAVAAAKHALELAEKVHGADSLRAAAMHGALGDAYRQLGKLDEALAEHKRELEMYQRLLGPEHPSLIKTWNSLGNVVFDQNRYTDALPYFQKAVDIAERSLGPDHPRLAIALQNLSGPLDELGKHEESLAASRRALAILEKKFGPDYTELIGPLQAMVMPLLLLKRPAEAIEPAERAMRLCEKGEVSPAKLAGTRYWLAMALYESGRDRTRAHRLVTQARDAYATMGAYGEDQVRDLNAWLSAHK